MYGQVQEVWGGGSGGVRGHVGGGVRGRCGRCVGVMWGEVMPSCAEGVAGVVWELCVSGGFAVCESAQYTYSHLQPLGIWQVT